jgi:hypothetical protein
MLKNIIISSLTSFSLIAALFVHSASVTPHDKRPLLEDDQIELMVPKGTNQSLCPKNPEYKFEHTLVLIDATSGLSPLVIAEIKNLFLSESKMRRALPYHRFTIMRLVDKPPTKNTPIFSMCRPRSGEKDSPYYPDKTTTWMGPSLNDYKALFNNFFMKKLNKALIPSNIIVPGQLTGSQIFEQIVQLERNENLDFFSGAGYEYRKLVIVSDLAQNNDRFNFLDTRTVNERKKTPLCKQRKYRKGGKDKCPTYEQFKKIEESRIWIRQYTADQLGDGLDLHIFYLNSRDPNLDLGLLELWQDYFNELGFNGKYNTTIQTDIQ